MADEEKEQKKKYQVVDRRISLDDDEAAEETPEQEQQPGAGEQAPEEPATPHQQQQGEPGAPGEEQGGEETGRMPEMADALRMIFNVLRERAFFDLGMLLSRHRRKDPDVDGAKKVADIFGALCDEFQPRLGVDEIGEENAGSSPDLAETVEFCCNMVKGQVFIYLGLVAHPSTGAMVKDLDQAKLGIDFISSLVEKSKPVLPAEKVSAIESLVTDLKMNYVNQLNQKT